MKQCRITPDISGRISRRAFRATASTRPKNSSSDAMRGLQTEQHMNVVFNSGNFQRRTFESANSAAKIFVEAWAPITDERAKRTFTAFLS
jgi:hypothetical protein